MKDHRLTPLKSLLLVCCFVVVGVAGLLAADPPEPPPLSGVIPAEDLVAQIKLYLTSFDEWLADEEQYKANALRVVRDANTLAVLSLVLCKHDAEHELKASAPALLAAARELAAAEDFAAAKAAHAKVQAAASASAGEAPVPKWEPVAALGQVMKQVTFVNNRLKRGMRRFDRLGEQNARDAAVLAAIAQAVTYDTHEVEKPEDVDQWYQFCGQMRDAAGELNARIKSADKEGADAAMLKLSKSCDACHAAFRPDIAVE
ncbi:MAG: hypothetical protein WD847_16150 [Pirellulales bacterium]